LQRDQMKVKEEIQKGDKDKQGLPNEQH